MTQNGPWSGRASSDEPYTEPADPWGDHPTSDAGQSGWGGHPTSIPPAQGQYSGALNTPPPAWAPPQHPPPHPPQQPRKRNTPIVALVIVLGLLICSGLGTTAWLLASRDEGGNDPGVTALPTSSAGNNSGADAEGGSQTGRVSDPEPRSSEDARFVSKGQCVRNEGTTARPEMKIVACASGTYEVLKRVDGRTSGESDAEQKCNKVAGYTKWYFYDSELDSLDFVLCLREK